MEKQPSTPMAGSRRLDFDEIHIPPGPRLGSLVIETLAGQSVSHQLTSQHGRPVLIVPESQAQEDDQQ